MRIEYDPVRDLLYIWLGQVGRKAVNTATVVPGIHLDLDASGKPIGLEILDAAEVLGGEVHFEVALPTPESTIASSS